MASHIGRRKFLATLGGAAAAWPLAARAQQPAMPVIGFLNVASADRYRPMVTAFRQGLQQSGYVEGQNVLIEYRWAEGQNDRLPTMVADLVHRQVTAIAATTTPAALAAKAATTTIPIVFEIGGDPVRLGLVASLNRPGGNVTGVTQLNSGLVPKALEVLHELLPTARIVALVVNPADPAVAEAESREALSAAHTLGLELHILNASAEIDLDGIFARLMELRANGLVIGPEALFNSYGERLAALAAYHAVPAIFRGREFTAAGGLASYGTNVTDAYRLAGVYSGRVLKGAKPADLPVQQATKVELFLNLKTAKTLGVTVPLPLSGRADEVIE
jgi:putative ABC transport system substrate-binding protein